MTEKFVNRDPTMFPEPSHFRPERWLADGPEIELARKLSVAFGFGNRSCVAKECVPFNVFSLQGNSS